LYKPITYNGSEGLEFIVANGKLWMETTTLVQVEEAFILGLQNWIKYLQENGHYDSTTEVYIASVWAKEKEQAHQIAVEVTTSETEAEGFGQNERQLFWQDGEETKEFLVKGGAFTFNVILHCKSPNRTSVSYLADAVKMGLETEVDNYLSSLGVNIPASSISIGQLTPEEVSTNHRNWTVDISIAKVLVYWNRVMEKTGEPLRNYKYYLERLTT
jgi:hypothetical protein